MEQTEDFIEAEGTQGITQGIYFLLKFCGHLNLSEVTADWENQLLKVNSADGRRYCVRIGALDEENLKGDKENGGKC